MNPVNFTPNMKVAPPGDGRFVVSDAKPQNTAPASSATPAPAPAPETRTPEQASAPSSAAQAAKASVEADREALQAAIAAMRQRAEDARADLSFRIDDELGEVVVSVVNRKDGTVLRQIPSEEALRIARALAGNEPGGSVISEVA